MKVPTPAASSVSTAVYDWSSTVPSRHITEASIVFNETISMGTSNINCALDNGKDVQTIALHELGHFAGLAESNDSDAAMYPSYNGCQRTTDGHDVSSMNEQCDDHP